MVDILRITLTLWSAQLTQAEGHATDIKKTQFDKIIIIAMSWDSKIELWEKKAAELIWYFIYGKKDPSNNLQHISIRFETFHNLISIYGKVQKPYHNKTKATNYDLQSYT